MKRLKGTTKKHFVMANFDAYQDGALAEKKRVIYEGHLAACQECQAWAKRQESLVAQLGMEMAPTAFLTPAAAERIQKDLYRSMRRAVIMNNIRTSAATVGALAVLALVVGVFVLWQVGTFGSGVQAPILGQGAAQGELVMDQVALDEGLLKALVNDDLAELASLLEAGADPNAQSSPGRPVLFLATVRGNAEAVQLLIDYGADVHAETVDGAILVKAADEGHREIVEMLLDAGADINATGRTWTANDPALFAAVASKHGQIARLLVERGADVNQPNSNGEPPLLVAAGTNQPEIVTLLLENGSEIDHQDNDGWTALHAAAFNPFAGVSSPEAAQILIEQGATLDLKNAKGQTPLDIALLDVAELLREAGATEGQGGAPGLETSGETSDE